MLVRLAPIATQNAQYSACTVPRLMRLMPKLSASTKASGANIDSVPSPVGATRVPYSVATR